VNIKKILQTFQENREKDPDYQNKINKKHKKTCEELHDDPNYRNGEQISKTKKEKINNDPNYIKNIVKKEQETCEELYGDPNYRNIEQNKQTKKEKYDDENYNNIEKGKKTKKEKYGDENFNNHEKAKQTNLERYGIENYNNREKTNETIKTPQFKQKMIDKGIWKSEEERTDYENYRFKVYSFTNESLRLYGSKYLVNYDILNENKNIKDILNKWNKDHKYSIIQGFKNNIDPEIIGSIINIEIIKGSDNFSKHDKCSITLDQLLSDYQNFLITENLI
jgi:hypothetical protein